jgi:hypothetical protein
MAKSRQNLHGRDGDVFDPAELPDTQTSYTGQLQQLAPLTSANGSTATADALHDKGFSAIRLRS